ncbi:TolC family protein [Lampropedia aestuarii]|uniref:TolC family protein n=1 Tax=Lampropedia aestuarii TaxID=2562762 RepID=UPI0024685A98|nr:TolC family protein [Lampropedia aestuarii]MDH5858742.1 TolC family protein [Lampropedia aestuarii]
MSRLTRLCPTPSRPGCVSTQPAGLAWTVAAALVLGCLPALAQTPNAAPPPSLQLAQRLSTNSLAGNSSQQRLLEALQTMVDNYPEILRAKAALAAAGQDLNTAEHARWPNFKVGTNSGSVNRSSGKENYNAINAEVRMSLLDGGAISANVRSAEYQQAAQASILQGTRQNTLLEALTALLELSRYEQKAAIAAESANIIAQLAKIEERRAELGAVGRNDLRQAASRQSSARAQQLSLESQRAVALARFTRYYSFSPATGHLPHLSVPAQWLPNSQAQALQQSESSSPELQEIAQQIAKAQAEVERSEAERFPTLEAVASHTYDPKGVLFNDGTRMGLELNWNFGNGFEVRDRIRKAMNELQSQQAQQEAVLRQVRETAASSWGRVQAGRARVSELQAAVTEAGGAFDGRRRLLEAGRGSLSQVLDAQLDMQNLMLELADAQHDQRINELQLVRTTGSLLPEGSSALRMHQLFLHAQVPDRTDSVARSAQHSQQLALLTERPALQLRFARHIDTPTRTTAASWW